jgi:hypothetical protein
MLVLVALSGVVAGGIVLGLHPIVTLSGTTLSMGQSVLRMLETAAYMVLAVSGLAALGVFISTQTDSGPGAAVATIIVAITSEILDNISSLHAIHGLLPTHGWQAFIGLFRTPIDWDPIRTGLTASPTRSSSSARPSIGSPAGTSRARHEDSLIPRRVGIPSVEPVVALPRVPEGGKAMGKALLATILAAVFAVGLAPRRSLARTPASRSGARTSRAIR